MSIQLEDVPLETAVRLLAEMAGLKPVRVGNVLFVTKKETANELRTDPDLQQPAQPGQPGVPIAGGFAPGFAVAPNPPPLIISPPPAVTTPAALSFRTKRPRRNQRIRRPIRINNRTWLAASASGARDAIAPLAVAANHFQGDNRSMRHPAG